MRRSDRQGYATLVLIGLAGLACIGSVDAYGQIPQQRHENRPSERRWQAARSKAHAPQRRTYPARAQGAYAAARRETSRGRSRTVVNYQGEWVGRGIGGGHLAGGSVMRETHPAAGDRVRETSRSLATGQVRVVRWGNALSGSVERTIRPGLVSRTFVSGGHVLYAHVYRSHVWHRFGRAFAYETFVPAVRYPAVYYAWALATWRQPVTYTWQWRVQPWYPMYGSLFMPYPAYTSPDLWMTDYIIAHSMQTAYQAQSAAPASEPSAPGIPAAPAPQPSDTAPESPSSNTPSAPVATPPAITPQVKAQLDAQIKVQLQERQAAAATPATVTTQSTPPALRPNHVFFQVVEPLEVPAGTPRRYCSLSANDYIKRTGGISNDDWMIPVMVELSGPSDCPQGLQTRIGLNDLSAMENEQEAQVMEAMQAASKSLGPNGPPSDPGVHPSFIADGSTAADPSALDAIRQAQ